MRSYYAYKNREIDVRVKVSNRSLSIENQIQYDTRNPIHYHTTNTIHYDVDNKKHYDVENQNYIDNIL